MNQIFISPSGNDNGRGSIENPLATLTGARDYLRKRKIIENTIIYLRKGRYFLDKSFTLSSVDSAPDGYTITYSAYENEDVFIDGGIILNAGAAKKISEETAERIIEKGAVPYIYEIDLGKYNISYGTYGNRGFRRAYIPAPNELFINQMPQNIARYPRRTDKPLSLKTVIDSGSCPYNGEFDIRPAIFQYDIQRCDFWKNAKDAYVSGLFHASYADDTIKVAKIDTEQKTITTGLPHLFGFQANTFTSWSIVNLIEEISETGDYFIDAENKTLYFYPPCNLDGALIQLSVLDTPMVVMENVSNIIFSGLTFENSRGTGVYIEGGYNCRIEGCTLRNLGMVAVQIGQGAAAMPEGKHTAHGKRAEGIPEITGESRKIGSWHEMLYEFAAWNNNGGHDHSIENCSIYNTGTGGILLGGGDRKSLTPANNYVNNCVIHNVNRLDKTYKAGVNISGVGNKVTHCEIFDMPGFAIYLHGNDHLIEYNKIHHAVTEVSDAGAIYMGRDISEVGNRIQYNFIYDLNCALNSNAGICAVYFDDYSSFNCVYGNFFYRVCQSSCDMAFGTVFWNRGGQTSVANNIFIDCTAALPPILYGARGIRDMLRSENLISIRALTNDPDDYRGVDIKSDVYREKYPYLYDLYCGNYQNQFMYWNNIIVNNRYDGFEGAENLNFKIKEDYERITCSETVNITDCILNLDNADKKFDIVDFSKIGVIGIK